MSDCEEGGDNYDEEGDMYQEESSESWCERLGGSITNICIGILFFFGSFVLLFWNEGRAVQTYDALKEGKSSIKSISSDFIDPSNEGSLVHLITMVEPGDNHNNLTDPIFGMSADINDLKLRRNVEMYQWKENVKSEKKKKLGGGTKRVDTYTYSKSWESKVIDSNSFKESAEHKNPGGMRFPQLELTSDNITLGAFTMPQDLMNRLNWYSSITEIDIDNILDETVLNVTEYGNKFYFGNDPQNPNISDTMVGFESVHPATVTIIAKQKGNSFTSFPTKAGDSLLMFEQGSHSAEEMFDQAAEANKFVTWILRLVGFAVMGVGLYLIMSPIEVFADVIPCVGDILGAGIMFVAFVIAMLLSGLTISIAWLIHHPIIGAIVLVVFIAFVAMVVFLKKYISQKRNEEN